MVPSGPKMANQVLQEAPRWLQDASSRPQGELRRAPGDPKMALRGAKRSPKCIREGPRWSPKGSWRKKNVILQNVEIHRVFF